MKSKKILQRTDTRHHLPYGKIVQASQNNDKHISHGSNHVSAMTISHRNQTFIK